MKKIFVSLAVVLTLGTAFVSCRETENKTEAEAIIEEAEENGAKIEVKDGGDKVKIENQDGSEVKIKTDDGDVKIKTDDN